MTSTWKRVGLGLVLAAGAQVTASAATQAVAPAPAPRIVRAGPSAVAPVAPAYLRDRINTLGRQFDGRVGIAVRSVDDGWVASWKGDELYPQQSVSKLWVSITALDAVDKGRVRLNDKVTLTRSDLTLFHQPIAQKILGGGHTTTLNALMWEAITKSDNTANDKLMRSVGGPEAVRNMIAAKKLGAIRFYDGERALQSKIAGLIWTQSYSVGGAFYQARNALPATVRKAAFDRYVADPYDGASPNAIVNALARLKRGELLSPDSTRRLLSVMGNTRTGANRLKGGLKPGWTLSHKTGTGQVYGPFQAGYNDIGVLTGPDGRSYAVAVMIKKTSTPLPTRMTLMNNVVRAVITQNEITGGAPLAG
ncbi:serine hydrolase [Sphingomonas lutea]|uniref:beta-lactamase n=1 Tax=Sphingomonas lutea TaxID=1045317 RepID=A0A7G9SIG0_9SPHN|nr:serine hydrolase [Sphingomonas lutea]QNN67635.1 serine hydrolase [Sphingomonas lutea]